MSTTAEQIPLGTGSDGGGGAHGATARRSSSMARRADFGGDLKVERRGPAAGRGGGGRRHGRQPGGRAGPLHGEGRCPAGRHAGQRRPASRPIPSSRFPPSSPQTASLVLGQNNVTVWSRTVDRLAVAVTEECPYTIEVVEPKVPLVRSGSMELKVGAQPQAGLQGADLGLTCPGTRRASARPGAIAIPEGKNEAVIPMNANGGAELRTWKIVVNGASGVATGPIMVSSQLANLTIAAAVSSTSRSRRPASSRGRRWTWPSR